VVDAADADRDGGRRASRRSGGERGRTTVDGACGAATLIMPNRLSRGMPVESDEELREVLDGDRVAVVGASTTEGKAAHEIPKYLLDHGYDVIPVNPYADEVLGRRAYDSLDEVEGRIDVVDVFRPGEEAEGIVDSVLARDDVGTVWLQLGITNDEAGERVERSGRRFVQDRCMKVEHGRLVGS
jgi:predicted CoA-binding protein